MVRENPSLTEVRRIAPRTDVPTTNSNGVASNERTTVLSAIENGSIEAASKALGNSTDFRMALEKLALHAKEV